MAKVIDKHTPLMKQYHGFKQKYPGALLLFRVGDFYETFGQDAITTSQVLGIVLTKRGNGSASEIELAGFPYHSLDTYLPKLIRAGHRVAICDQLEDPKLAKGLVKRGVTELITPGVSYSDKVLETKKSNYLASLYFNEDKVGCSFLDISTGRFMTAEGNAEYAGKLLHGLEPSEILISKSQIPQFKKLCGEKYNYFALDEWVYSYDFCHERLMRQFDTITLKGFGINEWPLAVISSGSALYYLEQNHQTNISHIRNISRIDEEQHVWLDAFTIRNLEILKPLNEGGKALVDILDHTNTPMGARLLRQWLVFPLNDIQPIHERLDTVEAFLKEPQLMSEIEKHLQLIGDLERIVSKVSLQKAGPREVLQMAYSLQATALLKRILEKTNGALSKLAEKLHPCEAISNRITREISTESPAVQGKINVFNHGIHPELDELRNIVFHGKDYLLEIQKREVENTGISSLKIAFNNVFGYYLEVTNVHKNKVPDSWIRKQTLTNAERYITPELKVYEEKILNAEGRMLELENSMFRDLLQFLTSEIESVFSNCLLIAQLDCLLGYAVLAARNKYVRPQIDNGFTLSLTACRHPVIEKQLPLGTPYIPNDLLLNDSDQRTIILTGPNMSGKSALLRQTALAVLMGQTGCYVACQAASFGRIDKIYTRVGASDNISLGESTFMVEMIETAGILNNLSSRSLVILDEIGRGTSTYDGISLAWSIAEFLGKHTGNPKTIFATHYHELNELVNSLPGTKNFHIQVRETDKDVLFLRTLGPGGSEHSFGIHVARMAGIPPAVLQRAEAILSELEKDRSMITGKDLVKRIKPPSVQLNMLGSFDPQIQKIYEMLNRADVNALTPIEALMTLHELKKLIAENHYFKANPN